MDFFDNALNKAKEAIDVVSKKTGEIVTVEKQKFDVSSLKSKLEKDYAELGKLYFKSINEAEELGEKEKAIVEEINRKLEAINELNIEIASAKAKRFCPSCKAAIADSSLYCSNCGEKLTFDSKE